MLRPDRFVGLTALFALALPAAAQTPPAPTKIVAHDLGELWHGAVSLHTNGSVVAHGNPWLGGGRTAVPVAAAADLTCLDALDPGSSQQVAVIGAAGLTMLRWNDTTAAFDATPWPHPQLIGGRAVRTAPLIDQHIVGVLAADGQTLHCLRYHGTGEGFLASSFAISEPVLDFAIVQHDSGAARVLVAGAAGLTCTRIGGPALWNVPGDHGVLTRIAGDPVVKAAWLHRDQGTGAWRLAHVGDGGVVRQDDLSGFFGESAGIHAASACDCNADGAFDLVVKTTGGVSVLLQSASDGFENAIETSFVLGVGGACIPDVVVMHGGSRPRLLDDDGFGAVQWSNLPLTELPATEGIGVSGDGILEASIDSHTRVDFVVSVAADWLRLCSGTQLDTHLQVVTWRQEEPTPDGRLDPLAEANRRHQMIGVPMPVTEDTLWPLSVKLAPLWQQQGPNQEDGWAGDEHYWVTIRLFATAPDGKPATASDPVTFVTTLSIPQADTTPAWPFVLSHCAQGTLSGDLPRVLLFDSAPPPGSLAPPVGGHIVGVISKIEVPPPPPPPGTLPSPADAVGGEVSERIEEPQ